VPEDYFSLLQQPRLPWLDEKAVQAKFLALSAEAHPDRLRDGTAADYSLATQRFSALNGAWTCLRDPKERLRHLLELEQGSKPGLLERLPAAHADFFFRLGDLCREVDRFLAEKAKATSPLLKVQRFQETMDWTSRLQQLQGTVQTRITALDAQLRELNQAWEAAPAVGTPQRVEVLPLERLESIFREWSYLARWAGQIRERLLQLAF
jgi:DnaJ-domain-containing protein 1